MLIVKLKKKCIIVYLFEIIKLKRVWKKDKWCKKRKCRW